MDKRQEAGEVSSSASYFVIWIPCPWFSRQRTAAYLAFARRPHQRDHASHFVNSHWTAGVRRLRL